MPAIAGGGRPVTKLRLTRFPARVLLVPEGDIDAALGVVGHSGRRGAAALSRDLRRCSFAARSALAGEISTLPRRASGSRSCPLPSSSSSSRKGSSNAREEADDWERRTLVDVVVFVDTDDELRELTCPCVRCAEARDVVAKPATDCIEIGVDVLGEESSPRRRRPTPCTPSLIPSRGDSGLMAELGVLEVVRSMPRLTMRSHLRFSCASSDSCTASCERNSRHFDSFCAMNCKRSACLGHEFIGTDGGRREDRRTSP